MKEPRNAYEVLRVGDYVAYRPSMEEYVLDYWKTGVYELQRFYPSKLTNWRVYKKENDEVVLISTDSVGELALCGEIGYARAVKTLNEVASAYLNPVFAQKVCSLGFTERSVER